MLFTTLPFVLLFLPLACAGFFIAGRWSARAAATWIFAASLFFYSQWLPADTWLLVGSICVNFVFGMRIARAAGGFGAKGWMLTGVAFNMGLLAWFKYANFAVANLDTAFGLALHDPGVHLPIGISFYSFTQIAFLVDTYRREVSEYKPIHYGLFVSYFPHLVAGPVLHHAQMMPQFRDPAIYRFNVSQFWAGLAIFALGLCKKVIFADGIGPYADAIFKPTDLGAHPDLFEAWLGALAYTFQLYFDFSGYSDMAIGLSWMFNVRLPFNFDSPYRSTDISQFWRRWHISLSTFLRDYLYIALGGNRHGPTRRYANLMITMLLGGLWHGASWTFVAWGALHGLYLMLNQGFRTVCGKALWHRLNASRAYRLCAWALTMVCVVAGWVVFRAETFGGSTRIWRAMAGWSPKAALGEIHPLLWNAGLQPSEGIVWCVALGAIAFLAPNSNRIGTKALRIAREQPRMRAMIGGAALCATLLLVLVNASRNSVSAFIYFNF